MTRNGKGHGIHSCVESAGVVPGPVKHGPLRVTSANFAESIVDIGVRSTRSLPRKTRRPSPRPPFPEPAALDGRALCASLRPAATLGAELAGINGGSDALREPDLSGCFSL